MTREGTSSLLGITAPTIAGLKADDTTVRSHCLQLAIDSTPGMPTTEQIVARAAEYYAFVGANTPTGPRAVGG